MIVGQIVLVSISLKNCQADVFSLKKMWKDTTLDKGKRCNCGELSHIMHYRMPQTLELGVPV